MSTSPELIIWGGTGNFKVLTELFGKTYRIAGYFDNDSAIAERYRGIPYLGDHTAFTLWINDLTSQPKPHFLVSLGPGHGPTRLRIHDELKAWGLLSMRAIHPTAFVADSSTIGEGSMVFAKAAVCVDVRVGRACIINTSASVDHECIVEDGATIGPGATLAGLVKVGACADIYTGATIIPRISIGAGAAVGAGAVVIRDVPPNAVVVGNPARIVNYRRSDNAHVPTGMPDKPMT